MFKNYFELSNVKTKALILFLGSKSLWDRGLLSGAGQKAECVSVFHVGE